MSLFAFWFHINNSWRPSFTLFGIFPISINNITCHVLVLHSPYYLFCFCCPRLNFTWFCLLCLYANMFFFCSIHINEFSNLILCCFQGEEEVLSSLWEIFKGLWWFQGCIFQRVTSMKLFSFYGFVAMCYLLLHKIISLTLLKVYFFFSLFGISWLFWFY